jgi:hypothetical protein
MQPSGRKKATIIAVIGALALGTTLSQIRATRGVSIRNEVARSRLEIRHLSLPSLDRAIAQRAADARAITVVLNAP